MTGDDRVRMGGMSGVYARRNAGHKATHAARMQRATSAEERFAVAADWLRASTRLLARRRPPAGTAQAVHRAAAERLITDAAAYLTDLAERIDRGEFDTRNEVTRRDDQRR
jgi:hypothetical protein